MHPSTLYTIAGILAMVAGWLAAGRALHRYLRRRDNIYLYDQRAIALNIAAVCGWWTTSIVGTVTYGLAAAIPAAVALMHTAILVLQIRAHNRAGAL